MGRWAAAAVLLLASGGLAGCKTSTSYFGIAEVPDNPKQNLIVGWEQKDYLLFSTTKMKMWALEDGKLADVTMVEGD